MAVASSNMPIKQLMGSTYSAGFDLTSRTPIDGRSSVQTLDDLTNEKTWRSRSQKDDQHPEYWLYNGLFTSVAETGKMYVLVGIDESQPATFWPSPAAPGLVSVGPRWIEVGGADSFLQDASIVRAKHGYVPTVPPMTEPDYFEEGDPRYEHVYEDPECTIEVDSSKYLKLVFKESDGVSPSDRKVLYCDISELVDNIKTLTVQSNGQLVIEFNGNQAEILNFVGAGGIDVSNTPGTGNINFSLMWRGIEVLPSYQVVFKDWDGTVLSEQETIQNRMPVAPSDPQREGYEFDGWNPVVSPIIANTEYIAQYRPID